MKITNLYAYIDEEETERDPEIMPWVYPSIPWTGNSEFHSGPANFGDPMEWTGGLYSRVFISKLFRKDGRLWVMELKFEHKELENWIESYIVYHPEKALNLLIKMLKKAWEKMKEKLREKA